MSKEETPRTDWTRYVPLLSWLPRYDRSWLRADAIAGLTLWGLVVPEAMAYAGIAGLPPQAGLYTLVASLLIYALLGTSRHLVVQATSATAALLASSVATAMVVSGLAAQSSPDAYQAYASAFVLVTGLVFLVAGLAKLGFITQFLSKPVMDGFVMGLAIFVAVGQLNKLFGVPKPAGNTVEKLIGIVRDLPEANWVSFAVGVAALALLFLLPRWNKKLPSGLIVLFAAIGLSMALDLSGKHGVEVVGALPQGLPSLTFPELPFRSYLAMLLPAMGVLLVAYSEALGVAHEFAERHGYEVDANQELNAHAAANLLSALFGGMLAAGSMSASAVKEEAGARTQVANLVTWMAAIVTLLFLTPLFAPLPEAVLGALIIHAVWHIIASRKLKKLHLASRVEFWFGALALAGVLLIDVLEGMVIGVVASLLFVIYRSSRPHIALLGRVPGVPGAYSDLARHPENIPVPGVAIVRVDGQLYYANALTVRNQIKAMIAEMETPPRAVVFDFAAQHELDVTSTEVLRRLFEELHAGGIEVSLADVHAPVLEHARRSGLLAEAEIGEKHIFPTVENAVRSLEAMAEKERIPSDHHVEGA
ncbi:MAG: SulP family inorganic anion transporter [Caldilineales bacterium]|nr:SulP family inorganic anion transporter [Caldilineales bacterium]MDW8317142.1 SulP family inorganic anion transporter [Anaerolineae bacterium]